MWDWLYLHIFQFFGWEFWVAIVALAVAVPLLWRDYLTRGVEENVARVSPSAATGLHRLE